MNNATTQCNYFHITEHNPTHVPKRPYYCFFADMCQSTDWPAIVILIVFLVIMVIILIIALQTCVSPPTDRLPHRLLLPHTHWCPPRKPWYYPSSSLSYHLHTGAHLTNLGITHLHHHHQNWKVIYRKAKSKSSIEEKPILKISAPPTIALVTWAISASCS